MATSSGPSGLPLDEYTASMPLGWKTDIDGYPLRLYIDKLQLWWKQADMEASQAAVLIAGRLKGTAGRLRLERPLVARPPDYDTRADALVRERTPL